MTAMAKSERRTRFIAFDAMRGVAALAVVIYHFSQHLGTRGPAYGYMAVDLFFVLSGFVLAYKYDVRFLTGLTPLGFLQIRLIRLLPLVVIGVVLGMFAPNFKAEGAPTNILARSGSALLSAVALPSVPGLTETGRLFPLDPPLWSIFFELWIANLVFGFAWKLLSRGWRLALFLVASAIAITLCDYLYKTMNFGWEWPTAPGGVARVCYSFFAGVALFRWREALPTRSISIPAMLCIPALGILLLCPLSGRAGRIFELLCVLAVFPLLTLLGVQARAGAQRLGALLGDTSFALYTIHFPILSMVSGPLFRAGYTHWSHLARYASELAILVMLLLLAFVVDRWADRPIRRWLTTAVGHGRVNPVSLVARRE